MDDPPIDALWDIAPCGFLVTDPAGMVLHANETLRRWLGDGEDTAVAGVRLASLLTPAGALYHDTMLMPRLLVGGEVREAAVDLLGRRRTPLPVFLSARRSPAASGRADTILMTLVDATERRRYEADLLQATRALHASVEQKNRILGMVAHDLRAPLADIIGLIDLIGFSPVDPLQRQYLDLARSSGTAMLGQIADLLDAAATAEGRLRLDLADGDVAPTLRSAVDSARRLAAHKGSTVDYADPGMPLVCRHDPARLGQVLTNLLSNALKFSPAGGAVVLAAAPMDGGVRMTVSDQGPGIPPDELPTLFTPFATGSARPTGGERRTGLGLAIVKRIVEGHGGRITVAPRPGGGSVFTVELPVAGP
jgi:two-component system OmpR family sensor kinase